MVRSGRNAEWSFTSRKNVTRVRRTGSTCAAQQKKCGAKRGAARILSHESSGQSCVETRAAGELQAGDPEYSCAQLRAVALRRDRSRDTSPRWLRRWRGRCRAAASPRRCSPASMCFSAIALLSESSSALVTISFRACEFFMLLSFLAGRGRSGRRSSPWSTPPRSPSRTSPSRPRTHRPPRRRGAASANRRSGRRGCRST